MHKTFLSYFSFFLLRYTIQNTLMQNQFLQINLWSLQVARDKHPSVYLRNYDSTFCNKVSVATFNLTDGETEMWRNENDFNTSYNEFLRQPRLQLTSVP